MFYKLILNYEKEDSSVSTYGICIHGIHSL
jgi:hypothetical protein